MKMINKILMVLVVMIIALLVMSLCTNQAVFSSLCW